MEGEGQRAGEGDRGQGPRAMSAPGTPQPPPTHPNTTDHRQVPPARCETGRGTRGGRGWLSPAAGGGGGHSHAGRGPRMGSPLWFTVLYTPPTGV